MKLVVFFLHATLYGFCLDLLVSSLLYLIYSSFTVVNCVQCHPFDCVVATSGIDSTIKVGLMDLIFVHLLLFGFLILQHGSRSGVQVLQFHQLWLGEQLDQKFVMCWKPWKATNEGYAIIVKLSCKTTSPCCPQNLHIILWIVFCHP
jgi:hypothetical protein